MIKVSGKPILWHILKILSSQGIKEFIICLGYKGNIIKNYISKEKFDFNVKCVSTGENTLTARRIFLIKNEIKSERFLMTYGDGVSNINISKLLKLHIKKKKIATVTAVNPIPRFGSLRLKNDLVTGFSEKVVDENNLINGGFFILERKIFNFVDLSKNVMWEQDPMIKLTKNKELSAYYHKGFWHCMDTERL